MMRRHSYSHHHRERRYDDADEAADDDSGLGDGVKGIEMQKMTSPERPLLTWSPSQDDPDDTFADDPLPDDVQSYFSKGKRGSKSSEKLG